MKPSERDLSLRMEAAEQQLIKAVEEIMAMHGLPCFLMEPIMAKIHNQLLEGKSEELQQARIRDAQKEAVKDAGS